MSRYFYQPTPHFSARLAKIKVYDPQGYRRIRNVINRVLENSDVADGQMHGAFRGRFKKYVGRGQYRLIYYYCELCRKGNRRLAVVCEQCDTIPDRSVVFFDVFHKNEKEKPAY
ncbi:MAG: toxin [Thermodesulfobacteriota bacterium]|nr:toxin [Thermodesulfobacteriota bacterium]